MIHKTFSVDHPADIEVRSTAADPSDYVELSFAKTGIALSLLSTGNPTVDQHGEIGERDALDAVAQVPHQEGPRLRPLDRSSGHFRCRMRSRSKQVA